MMISQKEKANEYWLFDQKCKMLVQEDEIRFAGLVGPTGRLVAAALNRK